MHYKTLVHNFKLFSTKNLIFCPLREVQNVLRWTCTFYNEINYHSLPCIDILPSTNSSYDQFTNISLENL